MIISDLEHPLWPHHVTHYLSFCGSTTNGTVYCHNSRIISYNAEALLITVQTIALLTVHQLKVGNQVSNSRLSLLRTRHQMV
jgi:hypothetical protein